MKKADKQISKSLNEINFDLKIVNEIYRNSKNKKRNYNTDLHMHTVFSDGFLSPQELVQKAIDSRLEIIAITDHNTVNGYTEMLTLSRELQEKINDQIWVIPGIEISTAFNNKRVHIVGLFVNVYSPHLRACIERVKEGHWERAEIQLSKLKRLGISISYRDYRQIVGRRIPNWKTVAEAIVAHGYASSIEQARGLYTGKGKPAHISYREKWFKISPRDAIISINRSGGLPYLAHLGDIESEFGETQTERMLCSLLRLGLIGVDVSRRSKLHEPPSEKLMEFLDKKKILVSKGSDFHSEEEISGFCTTSSDFRSILHRKIQRLAEESEYRHILDNISFEDSRFFPLQIVPNDFLRTKRGLRNILVLRRITSPYRLIEALTDNQPIDKQVDMTTLWNIGFESVLFAIHTIRCEHFMNRIARQNNAKEIGELVDGRLQNTRNMSPIGKSDFSAKEFLEDNLLTYCPIAYRLCYYGLGYELMTESLARLHCQLWRDIQELYNALVNSTFSLSNKDFERYMRIKEDYLRSVFSQNGYPNVEIHARAKSPLSLWNKLKMCWFIGHDIKNPMLKENGEAFLREIRNFKTKPLTRIGKKEFASVIEDFIAFRVVITNTKELKYTSLENIAKVLLDEVYNIDPAPRRWHHRRLLVWGWDRYLDRQLPVEIQCMNWSDYLLSRAYYWRSKGVYVHRDLYPSTDFATYRKLIGQLENSGFNDLHDMLLGEIRDKLGGR